MDSVACHVGGEGPAEADPEGSSDPTEQTGALRRQHEVVTAFGIKRHAIANLRREMTGPRTRGNNDLVRGHCSSLVMNDNLVGFKLQPFSRKLLKVPSPTTDNYETVIWKLATNP